VALKINLSFQITVSAFLKNGMSQRSVVPRPKLSRCKVRMYGGFRSNKFVTMEGIFALSLGIQKREIYETGCVKFVL